MKRLTKIRIKYLLIITCFFITLGIIIPTFMRYYAEVTGNVVGYAKETRTSTYKIKFHNNGGEGMMEELTLHYNVAQNLTKNTFTREDYNFSGWNTEADASGTMYSDGQEILNETYVTGNEINLYAVWTQDPVYTVEYNSNGGTGSMETQSFVYGTSQKLRPNTYTKEDFVFWHWNTKADDTGTIYEDEEEVNNLTSVDGDTVTLYAIYARERYIHKDEVVFDGTNYINTGINLFSQKNINKNFEVSFEIKQRTSTSNQASMMSAMNETAAPWPGMVYRVSSASKDQLAANATSSEKMQQDYKVEQVQKVTLKRISGILYLSLNDETGKEILDLSLITNAFDVPVTFGASLNGSGNPFRYFKGTLSNLKVIITDATEGTIKFDANGGTGTKFSQTIAPDSTVQLRKNTYTREGYEFVEWNTKADGTGTRYLNQESVTNIVEKGETIRLYAQWIEFSFTIEFNANGGAGSMESQEFNGGTAQNIKPCTFTKNGYSFGFWNTKADGTGKSYDDEQKVSNLTATNGGTITLYAIYEKQSYEHEGEIEFNGDNFINTDIYLFSGKNINKDFEISFKITDYTNKNDQDSLFSAMDESGKPWPGLVFRFDKSNNIEIDSNTTDSIKGNKKYNPKTVTDVILKRINGILYISINGGTEEQVIDFSKLEQPFYVPLTIGASLTGGLEPHRYFTGKISNINVTLSD